jgi:hypothetical protein
MTNVERAFLVGVKYNYRLAAEETRRDVEDLMNKMRAELHAVRSAARRQAADIASIPSAVPRRR